ncbi:hypothetical protein TWF506_004176 [Arthrobotrys conoides]|uniref:Uncharacterized protein n=1 Tax=Arthrobotrys conoides TaxID=74498 RepID=A0AAN8N1P9_9PEZI
MDPDKTSKANRGTRRTASTSSTSNSETRKSQIPGPRRRLFVTGGKKMPADPQGSEEEEEEDDEDWRATNLDADGGNDRRVIVSRPSNRS